VRHEWNEKYIYIYRVSVWKHHGKKPPKNQAVDVGIILKKYDGKV
jgi:hypothetical protein